jgi:hypothetical protein
MLTAYFAAVEEATKEQGVAGVFSKDNVEPLLVQTKAVLKI